MEIKNPKNPEKPETDDFANVERLHDLWPVPPGLAPNRKHAAQRNREISVLHGDVLNRLHASTDSSLVMGGHELGERNFPSCVCTPKKRDTRPQDDFHEDSDFYAVYLSERRKTHQNEIWISVRGTAFFARFLAKNTSANTLNLDIYAACLVFLFYHEIFHFNVDQAIRWLAGKVGASGAPRLLDIRPWHALSTGCWG